MAGAGPVHREAPGFQETLKPLKELQLLQPQTAVLGQRLALEKLPKRRVTVKSSGGPSHTYYSWRTRHMLEPIYCGDSKQVSTCPEGLPGRPGRKGSVAMSGLAKKVYHHQQQWVDKLTPHPHQWSYHPSSMGTQLGLKSCQ